jgi:hypothetical protein
MNGCGHGRGHGGNSGNGCQEQQDRRGCGGDRHGEGRGRRAGFGRNPRAGEMAHGTGPGFGRWRAEDREGQVKQLEERQRDLEQRAADMADLIRRLQQEPGSGESPAAG